MSAVNAMDHQFFVCSSQHMLPVSGGEMLLHIVKPRQYGPFPAVLLFMGMYGVNEQLRSTAMLLAERGFVVFVPDLYHHLGSSSPYIPADFDEALEAMHLMGEDRCLGDIELALEFIANRRDVDSSGVAAVGLCMGGKWGLVSACEFPGRLVCASSYYAAGLETCIDRISGLSVPVQLIVAGKDLFAGTRTINQMESTLKRYDKEYEIVRYPDAEHNFLDGSQIGYDAIAAADALQKTDRFIKSHLRVLLA